MYIYRIVIDANCINARSGILEMTCLEEYHDAGLIEILQTSTLPVEFDKAPLQQAKKANKYGVVGGCGYTYIPGEKKSQSIPGAGVRLSKMEGLMDGIFGLRLKGDAFKRALRDILHIDQAYQNDADVFVTNDKRLLEARTLLKRLGIELEVLAPAECLSKIMTNFEKNYGTSELARLREKLHTHGPIVLGSNSSFGLTIHESRYGESLIDLRFVEDHLLIKAKLRGADGQLLMELAPDAGPVIHDRDTSLTTFGKGPLRCSEKACYQFTAWHCHVPILAARTTHNNPRRVIFNRMLLRNKAGNVSVHINKEVLKLQDARLNSIES